MGPMDKLVTASTSPWLKMDLAVRSMKNDLRWQVVLSVFLGVLWIALAVSGRLDVGIGLLALIAIGLAGTLHSLLQFCEGAMERIRQLSTMV